jgi:2',3'-cyclic-nucleotide 2'-phosphodiesterase (5'-nucleotidase family)
MIPRHFLTPLLAIVIYCILPFKSIAADLTIVYTANTWGKLQVCGCPGDPYGGLGERVTLIKELRKKGNKPFILLDAGNMVSLFGDFKGKGAAVVNLMNLMKYDAVAVGPNEMFFGLDGARSIESNAGFPFLGSLIAERKSSKPAFKPYVLLKSGGNNALIITVCDSASAVLVTGPQRKNDYYFTDAGKTISGILSETSGKRDYVIVLSQLTTDGNKSLIEKFPEIDIIIEAYGNKRRETPLEAGNGLIFCGGSNGQFTGMATVSKSGNKTILKSNVLMPVLDIKQDSAAEKIIKKYFDSTK